MEKIENYPKAVRLKFIPFFSFLIFGSTVLFAQETEKPVAQETEKSSIGSISTDRPIQSETPSTVPKKYLQLEMGGQYTTLYPQDSITKYFSNNGNILFKYGLFENMELRISTNYIQENRTFLDTSSFPLLDESASKTGWSSPFIGFKFGALKEDGWKPNITYSLQSDVPLWGEKEFQVNTQNFVNRLTIGKTLIGNWYGIVGAEYGYLPQADDQFFYVVQTGYTFIDKLTLAAEIYGYRQKNNENLDAVNVALIYLLNDNNQFDISGGSGIGTSFYNYYFAVGYSFRFHH